MTSIKQAISYAEDGSHLLILSGQSNMARLDPTVSFIPAVEKEFGADRVIVAKSAYGGQPIRRWVRDYKYPDGSTPDQVGDLYDELLNVIAPAIKDRSICSVTFIWMQGERDAREGLAEVYEASFRSLLAQLAGDLKIDVSKVNVVLGRLGKFGFTSEEYPQWAEVREIQMKLGESDPFWCWVDSDSYNDGLDANGNNLVNDLHYSVEGYRQFGQALAGASTQLIRKRQG